MPTSNDRFAGGMATELSEGPPLQSPATVSSRSGRAPADLHMSAGGAPLRLERDGGSTTLGGRQGDGLAGEDVNAEGVSSWVLDATRSKGDLKMDHRHQSADLHRTESSPTPPSPYEQSKRGKTRAFARSAELATAGVAAEVEKELALPVIEGPRREFEAQQRRRQQQQQQQHYKQQQQHQEPSHENAASLVIGDAVSDQAPPACPPGSGERGVHEPCNGGSSSAAGGTTSAAVSNRGGQPRPKASAVDFAGDINEEELPVVLDIFDEGNGLKGNTAAAAAAAAAALASPEMAGGMHRPDLLGGMTGSRREAGADYGVVGGALHVALALVVLVLVAFVKADDGAVRATPYGKGAGCSGGAGGSGAGSTPSRRRGSRASSSSGNNGGGSGGSGQQRGSGAASAKRRKVDNGKSSRGAGASASPIVRHLRAAWSKLWHLVEDDLATRWHAAGHTLASLRQAWSALWMPPPHPEADVLAEALASPPRYSQGAADSRRAAAAGGGGNGGGGSDRRKRRSGRARSSRSSGSLGAAEGSPSVPLLGRPVGLNCLNFLSLCGYRPGGGRGSRQPKFLLLLDLDETLVHCSPHLMAPARRRSGGGGGAPRPDLKLEMRGRAPSDNRPSCMYAWKRPHLDVFLGVVSRWYEVAVFTSGRRSFAEPLIDLIDSRCVINQRFYRDSCVRRDGEPSATAVGGETAAAAPAAPETVKDLRVVGSEHFPLRTVLVDNQPKTVVQQANVLPVRSWFPRDSEDRQLLDLLPVLLALTSCQDVRSVLGLRPAVGGGC